MISERVMAENGDAAPVAPAPPASVQFLAFELRGQRYGLDVAKVEALVQADGLLHQDGKFSYEGERLLAVHPLDRWVGLVAGHEPPTADAPRQLLLSRSAAGLHGLLVDMPRDIVSLPLEAIYALPPLIRRLLSHSPLWGVGRTEQGLILLVDPVDRDRGAEIRTPEPDGAETEREAEEVL
jgi:chemotaxis signal transduction protein